MARAPPRSTLPRCIPAESTRPSDLLACRLIARDNGRSGRYADNVLIAVLVAGSVKNRVMGTTRSSSVLSSTRYTESRWYSLRSELPYTNSATATRAAAASALLNTILYSPGLGRTHLPCSFESTRSTPTSVGRSNGDCGEFQGQSLKTAESIGTVLSGVRTMTTQSYGKPAANRRVAVSCAAVPTSTLSPAKR